jgi:hypothetical protein
MKVMCLKSKWLIEQRLAHEDDPITIEALRWVLESPECPLCAHRDRRDWEIQIFNGNITTAYLESKNNWEVGIVEEHMTAHMDYDPEEAQDVEKARSEAITTLDMAEDVFSRITTWLDEWEAQKSKDGIDAEWLSTATRLVAQANTNIKLIGTLKKEIGVDSQMLLAHQQVNGVMGILVDVLRTEPKLLNQIEMRIGALKAPTHVQDAEWEVVD